MRGLRASFALVVLLVAAGLPSSAARGEGSAQLAAGRGVNGSMGGRQAPATGQVTAHDGSFWLGGKPILLRGIKVTVGGQSLADFQRFASWGANFVRMRVQWAFLEPDPPVKNRDGTWTHTYDASYVDEVVQSIAWAQQSGLYVMVSSHKCGVDEGDESCPYFGFPGWLYQAGYNSHGVTYPETDDGKLQAQTDFWSDSLRQQFYRDMFGYMVRQIDGEDGIVGYELMNEPQIGTLDNSHTTTQMVLDWQLSLAKMARNIDPARVITFTTRSGDAMGLPMADLSGWNALGNVALDVHDYHGARWGSGMNMNNQSADYGEVSGVLANHVTGDTAYLGTVFGHVNFLQVRRSFLGDIPMWVGEMGDSDVDPGVTVYFATVLAAVNSLGLTWTVDGGGAQGFINADDTLKPWGQLVLDALADGGHSPVATDNFTRSVANGWGTASSGQAWTTVGGPASDYAVNGSVGTMNLPTTNSPRMAYLGAPLTDQEVLVRFSVDRAPSTMRVIAQAVGRYDPTAKSFYTIGAGLVWDGSVRINATKRVGGSETIVGTEASLGKIAASGTWYWLRAQFVNEGASVRLKARAWKDGSSEPPTWQFSYLDSTNPLTGAGDPGLRTMPWATDVPFVLSFDDLTAGDAPPDPPGGTLIDNFTRSVANGWGTASSGQAWTTVGGPASDYAVNGSVGTMNLPTTNSPRMAYLGAPLTDQEVLVRFSVDRAPSTMRVIAQAVGRYDPTAKSFYTIGAGLVWDGSVRINATKRVGGSETIVGTEASLGKIAASGTWYWLRAQFVNEGASVRLKARAWKDGSSEPPTWQFSYLDSTNPLTGAGDPGLRTMPWATDVPFVLSFDDLTDKPI